MELSEPSRTAAALEGVQECLLHHARNGSIELRRATIQFPNDTAPRLQAATVRFQNDGQWLLLGFTVAAQGNTVKASKGRLQISGNLAGQLTWETSGTNAVCNLFDLPALTNNIASIRKSP